MRRQYCAFLVRCWALDDRTRRYQVTHIQSGERRLVATLGEALAWMEASCGGSHRHPQPDEDSSHHRDPGPPGR